MSGLSDAERESVERQVDWTGHASSRTEFNPACGTCREIRRRAEAVEQIIAARITAALNEAADAIEKPLLEEVNPSLSMRLWTDVHAAIVRDRIPTTPPVERGP